jgi:hypothetical protein
MSKGGKSGSPSRPKKLRGDASKARRYESMAREAAKVALNTEAHRRTLLRVIATLVEQRGGEVKLPFRLVAGAPDLGMAVEGEGTIDAVMVLATASRTPGADIIVGDRVVVHSWSSTLQGEPDRTDLAWPGRVAALDEGELLVVHLDQPHELGLPRVIVPKAWARREASHPDVAEIEQVLRARMGVSTRVDAGGE